VDVGTGEWAMKGRSFVVLRKNAERPWWETLVQKGRKRKEYRRSISYEGTEGWEGSERKKTVRGRGGVEKRGFATSQPTTSNKGHRKE